MHEFLNTLLPVIENIEVSYEEISDNDLKGQAIEKTIIPSNMFDFYTNLEILSGLTLYDHTDTLT